MTIVLVTGGRRGHLAVGHVASREAGDPRGPKGFAAELIRVEKLDDVCRQVRFLSARTTTGT
jgi:hypothetical protein